MQRRLMTIAPLALLVAACGASAASLGAFKVNDKDANLSSAVRVGMPPISGAARMVLVLSEKAPPAGTDANLTLIADPNAFGASVNAVLLKSEGEGWSNTTGCSVAHPASKSKHGNYLDANACKLTDVSVANGEFHAHLATAPATKDGADTIAIDVKLNVRMP